MSSEKQTVHPIYPDLEGKSIFLTGASRGIGLIIGEELARQQCHLLFNVRGDESKGEALASHFQSFGGQATPIYFDLASSEQTQEYLQSFLKDHGHLHGLVNNAGINRDQLLLRQKTIDVEDVLRVNLMAAMQVTQLASKALLRSAPASIVNMSSIVGITGNAGQSAYAASKAGLIGFTKSVARELGKRQIRCNAVCPGFIQTEMTADLSEDVKKTYQSEIPMARFGSALEVAQTVVFLLSQSSGYINGSTIQVDGGLAT